MNRELENNLIPAPIDNKNLMEDAFEDDVFCDSFLAARDHRKKSVRHFIGLAEVYDDEFPKCVNYAGYVDVSWNYGGNVVTIKVIGVCASEDFDESRNEIFNHYRKLFKSWECESNPDLVVRFSSENDTLYVQFYFDTNKC